MLSRTVFSLLLVFGLIFSVPFSDCAYISAPGSYELTADLSGVNATGVGECIEIATENVTLDCQGHSITSAAPTDDYGISSMAGFSNITIVNCEINGYDYGAYLLVEESLIEDNIIDGSTDDGIYLDGDNNTVRFNILTNAGEYNLYSTGDYSTFTNNTAAGSEDSCFRTNGDHNRIENNSAYFCDLVALNGGAFEIGDDYNILSFNHAENSSNGYYIEGEGALLTNNTAYGNMIGMNVLPSGWIGHTVIDNVAEENLAFDFMVGGDIWLYSIFAFMSFPPYVCNNTVVNLTGSGGREIFYAWGAGIPSHDDSTYSQILICGSPLLTMDNVTIDGSSTLNNNGLIVMNSNSTTITNSNSNENLAGFWFLNSDDTFLSAVNTSENFAGVIGIYSNNTRFSGVQSFDNNINASLLLSFLSGGGSVINETINLGFGALFLGSNNTAVKSSHFYNNSVGLAAIGDLGGGDMARGLNINTGSSMHDNDYAGLAAMNMYDISLTNLDAYNHDTPFPNITTNISFGALSLNLSAFAGLPMGFGGVFLTVDNVSISDSEFYSNYWTGSAFISGTNLTIDSTKMYDNNISGLAVLGGEDISIDRLEAYDNEGTFPNITANISFGAISMNLSGLAGAPMGFGALLMNAPSTNLTNSRFDDNFAGVTGIALSASVDEVWLINDTADGNGAFGYAFLAVDDLFIINSSSSNSTTVLHGVSGLGDLPFPINLSQFEGQTVGFGAVVMSDDFFVNNCTFNENHDGFAAYSSGSTFGRILNSTFSANTRDGVIIDDDSTVEIEQMEAASNGGSGLRFSTGTLKMDAIFGEESSFYGNAIGIEFTDPMLANNVPYTFSVLQAMNSSFDSNGEDFVINKLNTSESVPISRVLLIGDFESTLFGLQVDFSNDSAEDLYVDSVTTPPPYTLAGYDPLGKNVEITSTTNFNVNFSGIFYSPADIVGRNESNLQLLEYTGATWTVVPNQENMTTPVGNAIVMYNQSTFSVFGLFENSTNYTPPTPSGSSGDGSGKERLELGIDSKGHTLDTVTFTITVDEKKVAGAKVYLLLNGQTFGVVYADKEGIATFVPTEPGTYSAQAKSADYLNSDPPEEFSISLRQMEVEVPNQKEEGESFSILVTYEGAPIAGALVDIDGEAKTTGTNGMATFNLDAGTYQATVSKEGYADWSDAITVSKKGEVPEQPVPETPAPSGGEIIIEEEEPAPIGPTEIAKDVIPLVEGEEAEGMAPATQWEEIMPAIWILLFLLAVAAVIYFIASKKKKKAKK